MDYLYELATKYNWIRVVTLDDDDVSHIRRDQISYHDWVRDTWIWVRVRGSEGHENTCFIYAPTPHVNAYFTTEPKL